MLGKRFYDETGRAIHRPTITTPSIPTIQDSWRNAKNVKFNPHNWINAALAGIGDGA